MIQRPTCKTFFLPSSPALEVFCFCLFITPKACKHETRSNLRRLCTRVDSGIRALFPAILRHVASDMASSKACVPPFPEDGRKVCPWDQVRKRLAYLNQIQGIFDWVKLHVATTALSIESLSCPAIYLQHHLIAQHGHQDWSIWFADHAT